MDVELIVLFSVLGLAISLWIAFLFRNVALDKGYESYIYFWISFLFGIAGWALVISLPDKRLNKTMEDLSRKLDKQIKLLLAGQETSTQTQAGVDHPNDSSITINENESKSTVVESLAANVPGKVTPTIQGDKMVCPKCGEVQRAGRSRCWSCGIVFSEFNVNDD